MNYIGVKVNFIFGFIILTNDIYTGSSKLLNVPVVLPSQNIYLIWVDVE